ncbi:MAG: hypothetical protein AB1644_01235 [Candidatus Zixiibacteriota bacterium]
MMHGSRLFIAVLSIGAVCTVRAEYGPILQATQTYQCAKQIAPRNLNSRPGPAVQAAASTQTELKVSYLGSTLWSGLDDLIADGNYLYCAVWNGLIVFDVSTPSAPVLVAQLPLPQGAWRSIAKSGMYVYATSADSGLQIIDVTNPAAPVRVGSFYAAGSSVDVVVNGPYAFIAEMAAGMDIVDISNPLSPSLVGNFPVAESSYVMGLQVSGNFVWALMENRLIGIDVSNPASPAQVGAMWMQWSSSVAVAGNYVFTGGVPKRAIDVAVPSAPVLVDTLSTGSNSHEMAVTGNYLYIADGYEGLSIVDISNPSALVKVGGYTMGSGTWTHAVAVSGEYVYVAHDDALKILQVIDPSSPIALGTWPIVSHAWDLATQGNYAYVAGRSGEYGVVDYSNPAAPQTVGFGKWSWVIDGLAVAGNYAYLAGTHGLGVIDITNPGSPVALDNIILPGYMRDVAVSGNLAFVTCGTAGLQIVDITNPLALQLVGSFDTDGEAFGVAVLGTLAYVVTYQPYLMYVVDISTPSAPTLVGSCDAGGFDVKIAGNYAYVAAFTAGLVVADISNPANPVIVGRYDTPNAAASVSVQGQYAFVGDEYPPQDLAPSGLLIFDITNPTSPKLVGQYDTHGFANHVAFVGENVIVSDFYSLLVLGVGPCCVGTTGNIDDDPDDIVDISDLSALVDYLFLNGTISICDVENDIDKDGTTDISDLQSLIDFLFSGGSLTNC